MRDAHLGLSPTTQRREGYPFGECVRAAYATLLDLPIEAVPRFDPAALAPGEEQIERERRWLASIGYELHEVAVPPEEKLPQEVIDQTPPDVEHLMSGWSPRGLCHRVVGRGGRLLWDPHPSREGLVTIFSLGFLVPR